MAHHELSGKPFLQPRALGLGLAGGLLAELMLAGSIGLRDEGIVMASHATSEDELGLQVLRLLASEHQRHPVREWLLFVARTAAEGVARRLERSGYVTRAGLRAGWRAGRWAPVDADSAFAPLLRVRAAMDASRPVTAHGAALAGLATACGLRYRITQYAAPGPGRSVGECVRHLGPGLRELIAQTQAAVDSAVLSHRA